MCYSTPLVLGPWSLAPGHDALAPGAHVDPAPWSPIWALWSLGPVCHGPGWSLWVLVPIWAQYWHCGPLLGHGEGLGAHGIPIQCTYNVTLFKLEHDLFRMLICSVLHSSFDQPHDGGARALDQS